EWVNLMRWRLQNVLGYAESHAFTMKNTNGNDIYDMIFVSDHPVGDKIMRHLYGKALSEHEAMRQHAPAQRRDEPRGEGQRRSGLVPRHLRYGQDRQDRHGSDVLARATPRSLPAATRRLADQAEPRRVRLWCLIPGAAIQRSSTLLRGPAAPLLEEER